MNKQSIFHITDTPYAYAADRDTLSLTLKVGAGDVKRCRVFYKDRYDWKNPFDIKEMEKKDSDGLFDYYMTTLHVEENRYRYFFQLEGTDGEILYYNERGFSKDGPLGERGGFQFPYIAPTDVYKEVPWAEEGILYLLFPDRFSNGDESNDPEGTLAWGEPVTSRSMFGGDLRGIINKLTYLKELGVDILYLTPIFLSPSNHKYNTADYYRIDPHFGDLNDAKELVEKAHSLGMKVLFDAVFNHSGSDFFAFRDVLKNQEKSKYRDWFFIKSFPVSLEMVNYATFSNHIAYMPKLNTGNPEVKEYLLYVAEYWIKEVHIDGWRLDVSDEVDHQFWKEFRKRVKAANPDALIIGEIMHEASAWLRGDEMDGIMNYPLKEALVDFFAKRSMGVEEFDNELGSNRALYMDSINRTLLNMLDSHDTVRFLTECCEDINRLKLAAAFQLTYTGIPCIYYGDEVGISGGYDPLCRKCMIWDEEKQNKDLLRFYKSLIEIRKDNKCLVYGDYLCVYKAGGVLAYTRLWKGEKILVVLNNSDKEYHLESDEIVGNYKDLLSGTEENIKGTVVLMPDDIKILKMI